MKKPQKRPVYNQKTVNHAQNLKAENIYDERIRDLKKCLAVNTALVVRLKAGWISSSRLASGPKMQSNRGVKVC